MNSNALIIDCETAPCCRAAEYIQAFPKSKKKPGLHAIISQVVAMGFHDGVQPSVISAGGFGLGIPGIITEKIILDWLSRALREHTNDALVGFNIKNFDIPLLQLRAAKYGIKLPFPDKRSPRIVDLYEVIGGKWQSDVSSCSLSELGWFLYGHGKASSGAEVARMWAAGDIEGIQAHCLEDVLLTAKIFEDFKGVMW